MQTLKGRFFFFRGSIFWPSNHSRILKIHFWRQKNISSTEKILFFDILDILRYFVIFRRKLANNWPYRFPFLVWACLHHTFENTEGCIWFNKKIFKAWTTNSVLLKKIKKSGSFSHYINKKPRVFEKYKRSSNGHKMCLVGANTF